MAHIPVVIARLRHDHQPGAVDVSAQWRDAGADGCAGGGLLCEGIRHHIPGPTAERTCRKCPRGRTHNAPGNGPAHCRLCYSWNLHDSVSPFIRAYVSTTDGSAAATVYKPS